MNTGEIVFILEPDVGRVTVESSCAHAQLAKEIERDLGQGTVLNCARPNPGDEKLAAVIAGEAVAPDSDNQRIYLFRLYHDSTVDGFGRRSVVQVAGCSIRCAGFIYSLKWGKYDIAYDRTEPTTYCNRSSSRTMAQAFS
jgi:hypothetical protein